MNKLATLYKKTSTGAIQTWRVDTEDATIVTTYGQLEGKLQVARDTITVGKNIGRSNETTPIQQASIEAVAQWEKKIKKGYVVDLSSAMKGEVDETMIAGGINPMLAQSFAKHGHKIMFPAYIQPKLDGHRCIAIVSGGTVTLWSRTRKPIVSMPHIISAIEDAKLPDGTVLDGELYNHDYREKFEELTSLIRPEYAKDGHEVVQYHIYDFAHDTDAPFSYRAKDLLWLAERVDEPLVVVQTEIVPDEDDAMEWFNVFLSQGFEGAIIRNIDGLYVNKRSYDLQKIKTMLDDEFEIVNIVSGRGKLSDMGIFVCKNKNGDIFDVKMVGSLEDLKIYLEKPEDYIGRKLTVQYQNLSTRGIPRFAVGLRLREDI